MTLQQLRIFHETIRQQFNLTLTAEQLFTSQSGLSKHIKSLEDELGVRLFLRKGKRLMGLTEAGEQLKPMVSTILLEMDNIKRLVNDLQKSDEGELIIATTHTQARYVLPPIIAQFKQEFPKIHLTLKQADPIHIAQMLLLGEADVGIATESLCDLAHLNSTPFYTWHHSVLVPVNHPLTQKQPMTLNDLADYPIITYNQGFTGRAKIDEVFLDAQLRPDVVMSALDADVIKTYVELGLGVGIISSIAYHPIKDVGLTLLDVPLFGTQTTWIATRKHHLVRGYTRRFIELCQQFKSLN